MKSMNTIIPMKAKPSHQWKHTNLSTPGSQDSAGKVTITALWDSIDIIHIDFLSNEKRVTGKYYPLY
jgi:hypothetical protein